jgi:hypothetical protein
VVSEGRRSPSALSTCYAPLVPASAPSAPVPTAKLGPLPCGQRCSLVRKREVVLQLMREAGVQPQQRRSTALRLASPR